jgi:hypothetical protein
LQERRYQSTGQHQWVLAHHLSSDNGNIRPTIKPSSHHAIMLDSDDNNTDITRSNDSNNIGNGHN